MALETRFLIEEDEEALPVAKSGERLLASLGAARSTGIVPLALTIKDDFAPVSVTGLAISWTREAIASFRRIRAEARVQDPSFERNLPYASLRGFVEATLPNVARITRSMGLDSYALDPLRKEQETFVYLESTDAAAARQALHPILDNWIVHFLVPHYLEPGDVPLQLRDDVLALARQDALLSIEQIRARLLPWNAGRTGTASPPDRRGFQLLVDQAARCVAGKELFRGLGPIRRIVTARSTAQSTVELITDPITIGEHGRFSLVVSLEVVTFPSLSQPLITVDVSKRLWLSRISDKTADRHAISGSVFSSQCPDRAVSFSVCRKRGPDRTWRWMPDNAYEALKQTLGLPLGALDGHAIARGEASAGDNRVLLVHRDSVADGRHGIKRGVPELDKLEAFHSIERAVASLGLISFRGYSKLTARHGTSHHEHAKTINPPTLLSAVLEALEPEAVDSATSEFLKNLDDEQIDQLLRRQFKIGLEQIQKGNRIARFQGAWGAAEKDQALELDSLIRANTEAMKRLYGEARPQLVIFHEDGAETALRIVRGVARLLWGEAIDILSNRLPAGAHGPRQALAGHDRTDAARSELRVETWRPFAQQLAAMNRRTFCLVVAPDRYRDPNDSSRGRRDDRINKPAARQALATIARASVQYLLPPKAWRDSEAIDLGDFLHRVQAALKDLISAHSGRFEGLNEAVVQSFADVPAMRESMPREIIGITVVRKTAGRSRGAIGTTFLPIAVRIDVQTGRCEMSCAYENSSGVTISQWEPFSDALSTVSRISPVRLGRKMEIARTRFQRFVDHVISESVDAEAQPLVLIDSSNCVHLWNWLADQRLDVANIHIGEKQWMQQTWKGARIIRIRQNLAPGVVEGKAQHWAFSSVDDQRRKDSLESEVMLQAPTSPSGLFRLDGAQGPAGAVCYLSVGRKTLTMEKRGPSCYQETDAAIPYSIIGNGSRSSERVHNAADLPLSRLARRPPWIKQWPTPNPVEIVVTLRHASDDPDRLAELVERLRYGFGHYADWTSLPAPLFFERVVRDYVSGFALDDSAGTDIDGEDEEDAKQ